jgi:hypothetical protein
MTARLSPMSYVYDGRACLGFVLARGRAGFEAFTADEQLFKTQAQAANAVTDAAESERSAA